MVLSQPELREAVKEGRIKFDPPLEEDQWGPASVDLRLGCRFTRLKKLRGITVSVAEGLNTLSDAGFWIMMDLPEFDLFGKHQPFCVEPNEFVLAMTYEKITIPNNMIAMVEGRSTYARVGLSMHQTAPWIQPGWPGRQIVLEIFNPGPLYVNLFPVVDRPCQLTFFYLSSPLPPDMTYGSRPKDAYKLQEHPFDVVPHQGPQGKKS